MDTQTQPGAPTGAQEPIDDPPATPDTGKPNRLGRRPQDRRGVYMALAAPDGAGFAEVGWYRGHGADHVKRQVVADAEAGHLPDVKTAIEDKGALLRAVPAESWPKTEPTRYERPAPKLVLG